MLHSALFPILLCYREWDSDGYPIINLSMISSSKTSDSSRPHGVVLSTCEKSFLQWLLLLVHGPTTHVTKTSLLVFLPLSLQHIH